MSQVIKSIGFSIAAVGDDSLDRSLTLLDELGCESAELSVACCDVIAYGKLLVSRMRKVGSILAGRNLTYTVHAPLALNFMDEEHLDLHKQVCQASIEFCIDIESEVLVIHPGWTNASRMLTSLDRLQEIEREAIREMADLCKPYGIRLAMENMPAILSMVTANDDNYGLDPERLAAQIAEIEHPNVCATLDFSHAFIVSNYFGIDYLEFIDPLLPYVNHLHVHDSFGRPPSLEDADTGERLAYGMGDLHLPLGWGALNWQEILTKIQIRPDTVMTVEIAERYFNHSEIAKSLDIAKSYAMLLENAARQGSLFEVA